MAGKKSVAAEEAKKSVAAEEAKKSVAVEEAKKVVAKAEETKEAKAVKKEVKAEKKPAAKKETVKKETVKKETAKKEPAKKTAKILVQYAGLELDTEAVLEAAKAAYKAENKAAIKDITLYIKPEDGAAYYVVNGKVTGKVAL